MAHPTIDLTLSSQAIDCREGRRLRALELKELGWKQTEMADALGVTEGAVGRWMKRTTEDLAHPTRQSWWSSLSKWPMLFRAGG